MYMNRKDCVWRLIYLTLIRANTALGSTTDWFVQKMNNFYHIFIWKIFIFDFLISGEDQQGNKNFVIIELKQWQHAEATQSDGIVRTYLGGSIKERPHPSYQAQSYKNFLSDFNEHIAEGSIRAFACACLHNYPKGNPEPLIENQYLKIVDETPLFFRERLPKTPSRWVRRTAYPPWPRELPQAGCRSLSRRIHRFLPNS